MKELLKEKMHRYIVENNPELLLRRDGFSIPQYLNDKIECAIEQLEKNNIEQMTDDEVIEQCMLMMTAELRPSKFNYIKEVIEQEFPSEFAELSEKGILISKVTNIMEHCTDVFEGFGFSNEEEMNNHKLRHAIIAIVHQEL